MKCRNCKKENPEGTKYCKYCGELLYEMISCPNGHHYNSSEKYCPYCPPPDTEKTAILDDMKTIAEKAVKSVDSYYKTVIDNSNTELEKLEGDFSDKTVIASAEQSKPQLEKISPRNSRKLVGWLVTFDIDSNGRDFRLFEGRTTIGKNNKNDIILLDPSVSNNHATILYRSLDKKLYIQDNLSTNGTFVNDKLIDDKQILSDNDIIKIGKINLKVKLI